MNKTRTHNYDGATFEEMAGRIAHGYTSADDYAAVAMDEGSEFTNWDAFDDEADSCAHAQVLGEKMLKLVDAIVAAK